MTPTSKPQPTASGYNYDSEADGIGDVRRSASVIAPIVIGAFQPSSVVDFGCGLGDWLASFQVAGITDVIGLDGVWVPLHHLQIPQGLFVQTEFTKPIQLGRKFDVAICLEVAEHLPDGAADVLLDSLVAAADVVVFSAAIPGQGGYQHVNERFQQDWVERFSKRGFEAFDLVRPRVWNDPDVLVWYKQNLIVFANAAAVQRHNLKATPFIASVVHPDQYRAKMDPKRWSLRSIASNLPWYLSRNLRAYASRLR